ncbi:MAG TPA: glycosyltransferase family protein [Actinomycetota bacterium]|nr:glycosyltransferase family protein [Actinomycetota bacterium]
MRIVAIVQARMGSTRYPGKTLQDLGGTTLMERVLARVSATARIDEVVVATTTEAGDDPVEAVARAAGYPVVRGSVDDVLDRYVVAARAHRADVVVRNTADEPFLDPAIIHEAIATFEDARPDYVSNNLHHVYPEGLDTEVIAMEALERAHREATLRSDREHVTPYVWRQPEVFRLVAAGGEPVHPEWRLTVDYPEDLAFARAIYEAIGGSLFGLPEIVALLGSRPDLLAMCPSVPRREGYDASREAE